MALSFIQALYTSYWGSWDYLPSDLSAFLSFESFWYSARWKFQKFYCNYVPFFFQIFQWLHNTQVLALLLTNQITNLAEIWLLNLSITTTLKWKSKSDWKIKCPQPQSASLPSTLPQSRKWTLNILILTAHNEGKGTLKKLRFRSHKAKEKRMKEPCRNYPLSYTRRRKITPRKKYCYDYHIPTWYYLKKAKCSKINTFFSSKSWIFFYFVIEVGSHIQFKLKLMHTDIVKYKCQNHTNLYMFLQNLK